MEDRLWQTLAKPVSYGKTIRLTNESGNLYKRRCPMPQKRIKANTFYNKDNSYFRKSVYPEEFPESRTPAAVPPRIVRKRMYSKLWYAEEKMAAQALHEGAGANSHFLRTAGPHFPDSPGHIKRTAWVISRAEGTPPY